MDLNRVCPMVQHLRRGLRLSWRWLRFLILNKCPTITHPSIFNMVWRWWNMGCSCKTRCSHSRYLGTRNVKLISGTSWHMFRRYPGLLSGGVTTHSSNFTPSPTSSQMCCDGMGRTVKGVAALGPLSDSGNSWTVKPINCGKCWIAAHEWYVHEIFPWILSDSLWFSAASSIGRCWIDARSIVRLHMS